jgi:hypothetical protein
MTALYVLTNEYLALAEKLAEGDFDLQTIEDTLEASGITDELAIKAQGCEFIARGALAHHDAIDAEIARLTALKANRDKTAQAMRDYVKREMERAGIEKINCPLFKLSIKKNPPSVEVIDPLSLDTQFWTLPEPKPPVAVPNKVKIKLALQAGEDVIGARLVQATRLEIK